MHGTRHGSGLPSAFNRRHIHLARPASLARRGRHIAHSTRFHAVIRCDPWPGRLAHRFAQLHAAKGHQRRFPVGQARRICIGKARLFDVAAEIRIGLACPHPLPIGSSTAISPLPIGPLPIGPLPIRSSTSIVLMAIAVCP